MLANTESKRWASRQAPQLMTMEKSRSAFVEDGIPVLPAQNVFCTGTREWPGLTKIHFLIGIKLLAGRLGASGAHHVLHRFYTFGLAGRITRNVRQTTMEVLQERGGL